MHTILIVRSVFAWVFSRGAGTGSGERVIGTGECRCRVGANSLLVTSSNMIIDHIWAWRADHGNAGTYNGGRTYFFQNEMPYDPPTQAAWRTGAEGYAAYKVADSVNTREAWAMGGVIDNVVNTTGGPAQGTATVPSYVVDFP
jgi:hypothetical protein